MEERVPCAKAKKKVKPGGESGEEKGEMEYIPLYPRTTNLLELWPALLTKAILKVIALEYVV